MMMDFLGKDERTPIQKFIENKVTNGLGYEPRQYFGKIDNTNLLRLYIGSLNLVVKINSDSIS